MAANFRVQISREDVQPTPLSPEIVLDPIWIAGKVLLPSVHLHDEVAVLFRVVEDEARRLRRTHVPPHYARPRGSNRGPSLNLPMILVHVSSQVCTYTP